jgi:hypothetical protein
MKLLRTTSLLILLALALILNWNCSDNDIPIKTSDEESQLDGPNPNVTLIILEYIKVTPPDASPYYIYEVTADFLCHNPVPDGSGNYCTSSFTTPASSRTVEGNLYETQHYKIVKSSLFHCGPSYCNLVWYIYTILNESIPVTVGSVCGSEYSCSSGTKYCGTTYDEDEPVTLSPNTNYAVGYGGQCFVE